MSDDLSVSQISAMLARQASAVAQALLPNGQLSRCRRYWEVGSGRGKSLKVNVVGEHVGCWRDFAIDGMRGDLLDLVQETEGLDKAGAVRWAKQYLGIDQRAADRDLDPAERARRQQLRAQRDAQEARDAEARRAQAEQDRQARHAKAIDLWRAAEKAIGTPVERYYRARGIAGPPPATIRYLRRCFHAPSGQWLPAAIAAIQGPTVFDPATGRPRAPIIGVHRTYLHPQRAEKADVGQAKMMLGESRGGCVRLTAPASRLILCEGIETGLSLRLASTSAVWCGLSVGGMVAAWIPDEVTELILACDGDRVGSAAWLQARSMAVERHKRPGRVIRLREPPAGLDWNDVAQIRAREGVGGGGAV